MEEEDITMAVDGGGQWRLRRYFGPRYRTPNNTLTRKEVFTCAKSNNRRLFHVGDIDKTSKWLLLHNVELMSIPCCYILP
uniref:Uncharacterized protein n=1 Tax=Oryza nivara TaxID=4536 RepID=A0A0E0GRT0_ORYNI